MRVFFRGTKPSVFTDEEDNFMLNFSYIRMFRQNDNIKIKTTTASIILCTLSNIMLNASLFPMLVQT